MKIQRAGNTETALCFITFIENNINISLIEKNEIQKLKILYVDWIYKTAGYYDKDVITKDKFTLNDFTPNLIKYINMLINSYKNSDILNTAFLEKFENNILYKYKNEYLQYLNPMQIQQPYIFYMYQLKPYILNKKVLVISSFKKLIECQIKKGNLNILYNEIYKDTIFINYNYPYKFINDGPDNNVFETLDKIKSNISKIEFDISILSCGADGGILTDYIHSDMKKDAIYIGGHLSAMFGVFGKRFNNTNYNDYFKDKKISDITPYIITSIPEEERPKNYEKIENGCYW